LVDWNTIDGPLFVPREALMESRDRDFAVIVRMAEDPVGLSVGDVEVNRQTSAAVVTNRINRGGRHLVSLGVDHGQP
jgi:hypothetical protein